MAVHVTVSIWISHVQEQQLFPWGIAVFCTLSVVLLQEEGSALEFALWSSAQSVHISRKYKNLLAMCNLTSDKGVKYLFLLKNSDSLRNIFLTNIKLLTRCMFSCYGLVWLFATLWTAAHQAPLSMGLSPQEFYRGLPFLPPKDLANPRIKLVSPVSRSLQADSFPLSHWGTPLTRYEIPFLKVYLNYFIFPSIIVPTLLSKETEIGRGSLTCRSKVMH